MSAPMGVRKIRGVWCTDFRFDGKRYRLRAPENSKRGADAYEVHLKQKLMRGESIQPQQDKKPTFQNYAEYSVFWMKTYVQANNKPSEIKKKRITLDAHLLPVFGKLKVDTIDALAIERYKSQKVLSGLSPKTINNHLTILRKSLSDAKDWGYLDHLPDVRWLKAPQPKYVFLTKSEQRRLLADEGGTCWNVMVLLGLRTGMRLGEMMSLHWKDVDFVHGRVCVRFSLSGKEISTTKNNRIRYIPMTNQVAIALNDWKNESKPKAGDLVFGNGTKPMNRYSSYDGLHAIQKRGGLRQFGWHALRHTFATDLVAKGVPLRAVQELMGHSSIIITERYAHVSAHSLVQAVASLEGELVNFGHHMGTTPETVPVYRPSSSVGYDENVA